VLLHGVSLGGSVGYGLYMELACASRQSGHMSLRSRSLACKRVNFGY
jgi:hypothetical protein